MRTRNQSYPPDRRLRRLAQLSNLQSSRPRSRSRRESRENALMSTTKGTNPNPTPTSHLLRQSEKPHGRNNDHRYWIQTHLLPQRKILHHELPRKHLSSLLPITNRLLLLSHTSNHPRHHRALSIHHNL